MSYFGKKTPPKHGPGMMERKIKPNARYAGVGSRINSGSTIDKVRMVTNSEHLRRRDELFRRVSPGMLAELFAEYEPQGREDIAMASASGGGGGGGFTPRGAAGTGGIDSLCLGSPGGGGAHASSSSSNSSSPSPPRRLQGPRIVVHSPDTVSAPLPVEQPFLLLDVRSADAFRAGPTLRRARSFPAALLQRDNRFTADVVRFKNREEALIVVFGDDEREAAGAATRFAEKGYDNVFVLSGGLRAFGQRHPEFVEGAPLPPLPGQQQQKAAAAAAPTAAVRSSDAGGGGRSTRGGRGGGGSPARTPPRMARGAGGGGAQQQGPGGARRSSPMLANTLNRAALARHTAATGGGGRGNAAAAASEAPTCASVAASVISRATERKGGSMYR
jgi:centrosomal protein CEP41